MIDVLWPFLCTWLAKWAEQPPKVMKLRYAHTEICTQVTVICGPTPYQLYHRGTPEDNNTHLPVLRYSITIGINVNICLDVLTHPIDWGGCFIDQKILNRDL